MSARSLMIAFISIVSFVATAEKRLADHRVAAKAGRSAEDERAAPVGRSIGRSVPRQIARSSARPNQSEPAGLVTSFTHRAGRNGPMRAAHSRAQRTQRRIRRQAGLARPADRTQADLFCELHQTPAARQIMAANFSLALIQKIRNTVPVLFSSERRFAIVTNVEGGMRWPRSCRSVGSYADERQVADVKSRGPGAPMLAPSPGVMMIPRATVAIKPDTGESAV